MSIDLSDALIALGVLVVAAGLYMLSWPLVLVWAGLLAAYIGIRRS